MTRLSDANLEILRKRPQSTRLYLSIYQPQIVFKARLNNGSAAKGDRTIPYDTVSLGSFSAIVPNATMWVGTTDGGMELGKVRIRSANGSQIVVSENSNVNWQDDAYLTVFYYVELWPVFPRIIQDPNDVENTLWYKDYDIPYTNQNSILGTFVNMGPHRAVILDPASGLAQVYYSSTGSYNLLGDSLNYNWWFQGATVTGSSSANPGYITYNTPGHYVTRLSVSGSSGGVDTSYRYVSVYDQANPPIQKWELLDLGGSRDEGGYTASFRVFETIPLSEYAIVVLYSDSFYGDSHVNLGGNYPNGSEIFWTGYIEKDSIQYDYEHSEVTFNVVSMTGMMKKMSGFSVSVESKASPSQWYELLDMDGRRALYHYLRWHTTALQIADFQFVGDDRKIQFFDSDRESMLDAIDNYMRDTLIGQVVADRQGKVWMEVQAMAYTNPTGSFSPVMDVTNRDWKGSPSIEEEISTPMAYIEFGGIAYSGTSTGTFTPLLADAPGNAPGFRGDMEIHEGLALLGQDQLNSLVGNVFANKNAPYPSIETELVGNYTNLDIAPQETVGLHINRTDTVRNKTIDGLFLVDGMRWVYDPENFILIPETSFKQLVSGEAGQTITVPDPQTEIGAGFNVPGIQIPSLPPLSIPSGFSSSSGSSCCDTLGGLISPNTYSLILLKNQLVQTTSQQFFSADYASNYRMYDPVYSRIYFLNSGTVDYNIKASGFLTVTGDPGLGGAAQLSMWVFASGTSSEVIGNIVNSVGLATFGTTLGLAGAGPQPWSTDQTISADPYLKTGYYGKLLSSIGQSPLSNGFVWSNIRIEITAIE